MTAKCGHGTAVGLARGSEKEHLFAFDEVSEGQGALALVVAILAVYLMLGHDGWTHRYSTEVGGEGEST